MHREYLAVVWPILLLRPYLEGSQLTIRTDHDKLRSMLKMTKATGTLMRWCILLSELDFEVVHSGGIKYQASNALSPENEKTETEAKFGIVSPIMIEWKP